MLNSTLFGFSGLFTMCCFVTVFIKLFFPLRLTLTVEMFLARLFIFFQSNAITSDVRFLNYLTRAIYILSDE